MPAATLWDLADLCTPWCVHVVATLRVADHLDAGITRIDDLAAACGAQAESLHRVLRHLVAKGLFEEPSTGVFALNDLARGLLGESGRIGFDLDGIGGRMAHAWSSLPTAVRTGAPAYHEIFGRPFWEDLEANPAIAASFDALMGAVGHGTPDPEILVNGDWDAVHTVVDVGGGTGAMLVEILRARPHVRGILVDLPGPISRSRGVFRDAGASIADRATTVAQSFFDPLPRGGDVYLFKNALADWPDREAQAILARCADAAHPHGRVVVLGGVSPDRPPGGPEPAPDAGARRRTRAQPLRVHRARPRGRSRRARDRPAIQRSLPRRVPPGLISLYGAGRIIVDLVHRTTDRRGAPMTRYERVIQILDQAIGGPTANIGSHRAFWRGLTRDELLAKKVFGRTLVDVGNGAASNLVKALRGQTPFGADLPDPPAGASISRMPSGMNPVPDADIAFVEQWITDGCPDQPDTGVTLRWRPTNAPIASSRTDDIWFVDPRLGWAANSNGQIVKTEDGGDSWQVQLHDEECYFRCLGFATPKRGWAGTLTAGKTLFETRDGGARWKPVANLPANAPPAICGLSVVNEQVVFAAGTNFPHRPVRVLKTVDGGQTWTAIDMKPFADMLIDIFFTSPTHGWVVGGKTDQPTATRDNVRPVVLRTEDGGQTWVNRAATLGSGQLVTGEWGWKVQFLDTTVGFVSLENFTQGAILKTIDGGATWSRHAINDQQKNANLEGVGFIDDQHGWVGGWGDEDFQRLSSSETRDGGLNWRDANEIGRAINRFRFFGHPVTVGYASGETVYKLSSEPVPEAVAAAAPRRGVIFESLEPAETTLPLAVTVTVPAGAARLTVRIWDRFGEALRVLVDEHNPEPGTREVVWDGRADDGRAAGAGYFIWRATIDDRSESRLIRVR